MERIFRGAEHWISEDSAYDGCQLCGLAGGEKTDGSLRDGNRNFSVNYLSIPMSALWA